MIENLLDQSVFKNGHEVSFILGHRVLSKSGQDWNEVRGGALAIGEWEDLKDLCLQGNEKVQLETKGFVAGIFESQKHRWRFSFIERKDCFRAHLSLLKAPEEVRSQIENPLFWDTVKKEKGLFLVAGERRQGKTALLQEIAANDQKNSLSLVGIHSALQNQAWPEMDSVVQLGSETLDYDFSHIIYEGIERLIVDTNSVRNWKKWIEMAEQGQGILMSLSSNSVQTILTKLKSELDAGSAQRLFSVLNGIVVQKLVGPQYQPCHEILILKENHRTLLNTRGAEQSFSPAFLQAELKDSYQSVNQSLIQKLVRRKIDVQSAFGASDDPQALDATLKKMGL